MQLTRLLAMIVAASGYMLSGAVEAKPIKWRASWELIGTDDKNCGPQASRTFTLQLSDDKLRRYAASGAPRDLKLLEPLNADGSGKVRALTPNNREVVLEFEPGDGPRLIRYSPRHGRYDMCTWTWVPV
jgi:hypothetical protein